MVSSRSLPGLLRKLHNFAKNILSTRLAQELLQLSVNCYFKILKC